MNKAWTTSLSIAGVIGSGTAAALATSATMNDSGQPPAAAVPSIVVASTVGSTVASTPAATMPQPVVEMVSHIETPTQRTVQYQVGAAGTVTVHNEGGQLRIDSATPGSGWTVASATDTGAPLAVVFTDGAQTVTFTATGNGLDIIPSVASMAGAPGAPIVLQPVVPAATAPVLAAAPAGAAAVTAAPVTAPTTAHTSTPSGSTSSGGSTRSYDDDDDDEYEDDDHDDDDEYEDDDDDGHDDEDDDESEYEEDD